MFRFSAYVLALLLCLACSHKKHVVNGGQTVGQGLSISGNWVKPKGRKFDTELTVRNDSGKPVIISMDDLQCSRGGQMGVVRDSYGSSDRNLSLAPNQTKTFKVFCVNTANHGNYNVTITKVYSNPKNDGTTKGAVASQNVQWQAAD